MIDVKKSCPVCERKWSEFSSLNEHKCFPLQKPRRVAMRLYAVKVCGDAWEEGVKRPIIRNGGIELSEGIEFSEAETREVKQKGIELLLSSARVWLEHIVFGGELDKLAKSLEER